MTTYTDFQRYLNAKRTVDDRALNRMVWERLRTHINPHDQLRVVEVGAGTGTMLERMANWGLFNGQINYTGIDTQPDNITEARARIKTLGDPFHTQFVIGDALSWKPAAPADLLIAHAVMDILPMQAALNHFRRYLKPGGLLYLTIVFDGLTLLEPILHPQLDAQIQRLYHADMDARNDSTTGGSHAGRALLNHLNNRHDVNLLAAGASDWVVFPHDGSYPDDEAYFLHFIIETIHGALAGHPDLDAVAFSDWVARRHTQVDSGELVYIAHQLDFLGQFQ